MVRVSGAKAPGARPGIPRGSAHAGTHTFFISILLVALEFSSVSAHTCRIFLSGMVTAYPRTLAASSDIQPGCLLKVT